MTMETSMDGLGKLYQPETCGHLGLIPLTNYDSSEVTLWSL